MIVYLNKERKKEELRGSSLLFGIKWFAYEIKETFNNWLWCLPFTRIKDNVRPLSIKEKDEDLHDVFVHV